ncbi:glycosyltransferase [Enterobacter ludwigii]
MERIAIIDPASYALPYDFFYVKSLSQHYNIDFYCSRTKYNYEYVQRIKTLPNVIVYEYSISGVNKYIGVLNYIRMLFTIVSSSKKYSSINLQWSLVTLIELAFLLFVKSKLIVTFHNSVPHGKARKAYFKSKAISFIANKLLFVSNYTRDDFLLLYGNISNIKDKMFVLNHGVMPLNIDEKMIEEFTTPPKRIVFWGNVKDYKGVDFLAEAIPFINRKGYSLEVYGKFDKDKKNLYNKLTQAGVKVVDQYLKLDEIEEILSSNIILALPYKAASQSGVMYTALYYNTVMIATDCGDPHEFLKECNLEKLSFKYNDLDSLEKSLDYLTDNYETVKERIKLSKSKYHWDYPYTVLDNIFGS